MKTYNITSFSDILVLYLVIFNLVRLFYNSLCLRILYSMGTMRHQLFQALGGYSSIAMFKTKTNP